MKELRYFQYIKAERKEVKVKKVLIEIHHGIGDVVHMIPVFDNFNLSEEYEISVIVNGEVQKELLESLGYIKNIYKINLNHFNIKKFITTLYLVRKEKFDIGIVSPISNVFFWSFLILVFGCKQRIGEVENRKIHFYNMICSYEPNLHRVEKNLKLLSVLPDVKRIVKSPHIKVGTKEKRWAKIMLLNNKKIITICMGTGKFIIKKGLKRIYYDAKFWGKKKNWELIDKLCKKGLFIVLAGGKKEEMENLEELEYLKKQDGVRKNILNLVNKASIMQMAAILEKSDMVFGCDTGLMHLAAAVDVKTFTIFGPADPLNIGAYSKKSKYYTLGLKCQYCYGTPQIESCINRRCIKDIRVEDIYREIIDFLTEEG